MIQSLLTQEEYDKLSRKYGTYNPSGRNSQEDGTNAPPNYIMGDRLSPLEVKVINSRLSAVLEKAGLLPKHDIHRSGDGHYPGLPFHP